MNGTRIELMTRIFASLIFAFDKTDVRRIRIRKFADSQIRRFDGDLTTELSGAGPPGQAAAAATGYAALATNRDSVSERLHALQFGSSNVMVTFRLPSLRYFVTQNRVGLPSMNTDR